MLPLILLSIKSFSAFHERRRIVAVTVTSAVIIGLAFPITLPAQAFVAQSTPPFAVTISTSTPDITNGRHNQVTIVISNQTNVTLSLSSRGDFWLIDTDAKSGTRLDANFYAPVSFVKPYETDLKPCQDDLTPERVTTSRHGQVLSIRPPKAVVVFAPGEGRTFRFDLTQVCWNHRISSVYPNRELFELLADYPALTNKSLSLSFHAYASGSTKLDDGRTVDEYTEITSNAIKMAVR